MIKMITMVTWQVLLVSVVASLAVHLLFELFRRLVDFLDIKGHLALVISELTLNGGILKLASEQGIFRGRLSLELWKDSRVSLARFLQVEVVVALQDQYHLYAVLNELAAGHCGKSDGSPVLTPDQTENIKEQLWKTVNLIEILRSYSGWGGLLPWIRKKLPPDFPLG